MKVKLLPLAVLGGISPMVGIAQENKKPNIILIMTDQQRFDCVGIMGNTGIKTPNLDALGHDGVVFSNAYTSTPSSTPARAGLLTGSSPWQHGLLGYNREIGKKYPNTMPQMLHDAGYFTFGIGKMHYAPQRNPHGFHGLLLDESGRVESPDFVSDYRQWFMMEAPGVNPDSTGLGWNDHAGRPYALEERLHPTQWTGNQAVRFIENYKQDNPLFLKISFARPHSPYDPPQRYADMYTDKDVIAPWIGDWSSSFAKRESSADAAFGDYGLEHAMNSRRHYYGAVTFVDDQIGRVIDALKEKGIYDNSLIIFVSDHGDMLGDHYHWRKTYAYEGSAHIPFIVKAPKGTDYGKSSVKTVDKVVEIRDVLPTFLEAANISQPANMDGLSVIKLMKNKDADWRPYIDLEHAAAYEYENYWAGLTDGKMKYIWFFRTGEEQLFDMTKDPSELKNLASQKSSKKQLLEWRGRMVEHLKERGEPYVKNGELATFKESILKSPNFPAEEKNKK